MEIVARHFEDGRPIRLVTDGPTIVEVGPAEEAGADLDWIAPAFWDIQTNGRWGISFSDPDLTVEQVAAIVRAQASLGTARLCPTLISDTRQNFLHGVSTIAAACAAHPDVAACVIGIHLEGPYLSGLEGYRGAHPPEVLRDPDWDEFQAIQDASGGRVVLTTIAPERAGSIEFIRRATAEGIAIALGHTAADGPTLRAAVAAGARLSTHLGNGIAAQLDRHPNPIWVQAAHDDLRASIIADGHHVGPEVLRVLVRAKTPDRIVLVSDASPLAGLPPGRYGRWAVDPSGKIIVAGTPYLAGSNQGIEVGINTLIRSAGLSIAEALATATIHPARVLGRPEPTLSPGQPANLIRFRTRGEGAADSFELVSTCVDGNDWVTANPVVPPPAGFPIAEPVEVPA